MRPDPEQTVSMVWRRMCALNPGSSGGRNTVGQGHGLKAVSGWWCRGQQVVDPLIDSFMGISVGHRRFGMPTEAHFAVYRLCARVQRHCACEDFPVHHRPDGLLVTGLQLHHRERVVPIAAVAFSAEAPDRQA